MADKKKTPKNKSTPFEHSGNFSVGAPLAGESLDKKKKQVEEEDEEEDEEHDEEEEEIEDPLANLAPEVLRRVTVLRKQHDDYEKLDDEYKLERAELEKKFIEKKRALYETRRQIVNGEIDPPAIVEEGEEAEAPADAEGDAKGVPSFWLNVLTSHPSISGLITEEDDAALEHLTNITCDYDGDFTSFVLNFHFSDNEFFTNTLLTKKYVVAPSLFDDKNPSLVDCEGSEISWKEGKNLCVTEVKKKQKAKAGKNKGQVRTVVKQVPKPSFFHFFKAPKRPEEDEEEEQEEKDEEEEQIELTAEEDYDVGHMIRTSIIPEAILYFTKENEDGFDDEDLDYADFGEEGDEDEEGDEEEEGEAEEAPKKGGKKGFAKKGKDEKAPECKQN